MSDRGLAKACRRIRVPVPPRGYWAKAEAGHRPRRPKLPAVARGEVEEVMVWQVTHDEQESPRTKSRGRQN
jgi:hypothetical protein